jgi:hypothetical protein
MNFLKSLFKLIQGFFLFYFAYVFVKWYVKGHFGKYFIFFWLNTIMAFVMFFNHQNKIEEEYDHRTGAEVWEQNRRNAE